MSKVVINEKEELVKLDNLRIRDREMVPEVTIATSKVTETMKNPDGDITGIISRIERIHTVILKPEEFYKIWKKTRKKKVDPAAQKNKEQGKARQDTKKEREE